MERETKIAMKNKPKKPVLKKSIFDKQRDKTIMILLGKEKV